MNCCIYYIRFFILIILFGGTSYSIASPVTSTNSRFLANNAYINNTPLVFVVNTYNTKCSRSEGIIAAIASGGIAPYTYSLNNRNWQNTGVFAFLSQGTYTIYAKDAVGILDSINATITNLFTPPSLALPAISSLTVCDNPIPSYTVTASGGQPPYLYTLDLINMQSSPTFTNVYGGEYFFIVQDANGCERWAFQSITNFRCDAGSLSIGYPQHLCTQGVIEIRASCADPPCLASLDGGPYLNYIYDTISPGVHKVIRRNGIGDSSTWVVTIPRVCSFGGSAEIIPASCNSNNGMVVKINVENGVPPFQFSADGINFSSNNSFTGLASGEYQYLVKDFTGKVGVCYFEIYNNCPQVYASSISTNCGLANGIVNVSGTLGTRPYLFSINGSSFQADSVITGLGAGSYTIVIKDNLGFTDTTSVEVRAGGCFTLTTQKTDATCQTLGKIVANGVNGTPIYQYSLDSVHFQASGTFTNLPPGNYTVYARDRDGKTATAHDTIGGALKPFFSLRNDTAICGTASLLLLPDSIYTGAVYNWSTGENTSSIIANSSNLYWLEITSQQNCKWRDSVNVTFKPVPFFNLGNDTAICEKDSILLTAATTNADTYMWGTSAATSTVNVHQPGIYWCNTEKAGCIYSDSIVISQKLLPFVSLGVDTTLCEGETKQLHAFNSNATYVWQDQSTSEDYIVNKAGIYYVSVNKAGCIASDTITVNYELKPSFTLGNDQLICSGQKIILKPLVNNMWQLLWQDGSQGTTYTVTQEGGYFLEAANICGRYRDSVVFTEGICNLYIPSAFSPNGDRWNNVFKVSGTALVTQFHLQIFNRYGQLIFETTDKNKGWDGLYNSQPVQAGAYVYVLQYKDNKKTHSLKGSILLIR